jgi:isocitrate/isopropylmalate dehydrogenase
MVEWLGEREIASTIERAVAGVVERGAVRTYDLGGSASTMEVARSVAESVRCAHVMR